MRLVFVLLWVSGYLLPLRALAQGGGQLIFNHDESGECRVKPEDIRPIIDRMNPFFYNHTWDDKTKTETAQLSPGRTVTITQRACLRHHYTIELDIDPQLVPAEHQPFYVVEMFNLLNRLFFNQSDYFSFKNEFERTFIEYYERNGDNVGFSFPLVDRTYLVYLSHERGKETKLQLEFVRFLLRENIKLPGVEAYRDDGHFVAPTPNRP